MHLVQVDAVGVKPFQTGLTFGDHAVTFDRRQDRSVGLDDSSEFGPNKGAREGSEPGYVRHFEFLIPAMNFS